MIKLTYKQKGGKTMNKKLKSYLTSSLLTATAFLLGIVIQVFG